MCFDDCIVFEKQKQILLSLGMPPDVSTWDGLNMTNAKRLKFLFFPQQWQIDCTEVTGMWTTWT